MKKISVYVRKLLSLDINWKACFIIIFFIKLYIKLGMSLWFADSTVDDLLFLELADNVVKTGWLGEYSVITLNKMPGYALFLALSEALNLPYVFVLEVFYATAVYISVVAFKHIVDTGMKKVIMILYLMFSPACFDISISSRIYRLAIVPGAVMLVVALYAGLYFRREEVLKKKIIWAVGAGVGTLFFWIVREDSIWLAPYIFGAGIIIILSSIKLKKEKLWSNIALVLGSYVIFFGGLNTIKFVNYVNYGIYTLTDFSDTNFARATGAILSIEPQNEKEYVWVDRETMDSIIECSPALQSIQEEIEYMYGVWDGYGALGVDGEIEKDYIVWALRQAADRAGIYAVATNANDFWSTVANEVEFAIKTGKLTERDGIQISNLAKPIETKNIGKWFECSYESIQRVLGYKDCHAGMYYTRVDDANIRKAESITNQNIRYSDIVQSISWDGWIFAWDDNNEIEIKLIALDGEEVIPQITQGQRLDVHDFYAVDGEVHNNAKECGINLNAYCEQGFDKMEIYIDNTVVYSITIEKMQKIQWIENEYVMGAIESLNVNGRIDEVDGTSYDTVGNDIIRIYRKTSAMLNVVAIVGFLILLITAIKNKKRIGELLVLIGMVGCYLALHIGVGLNYFEAHNREGRYSYLAGTYPLQQLFIILTIFILFAAIKEFLKETKEKRKLRNEVNHPDTLL